MRGTGLTTEWGGAESLCGPPKERKSTLPRKMGCRDAIPRPRESHTPLVKKNGESRSGRTRFPHAPDFRCPGSPSSCTRRASPLDGKAQRGGVSQHFNSTHTHHCVHWDRSEFASARRAASSSARLECVVNVVVCRRVGCNFRQSSNGSRAWRSSPCRVRSPI